jgi:hypothetical protein
MIQEGEHIFEHIQMISLPFYCKIKHEWGKRSCIDECKRNEGLGIYKL